MLRRTKREVLTELPPKRRLVQEIDWDDEVYRELHGARAPNRCAALRDATDPVPPRADRGRNLRSAERQATGVAKAPYVCAFVRALLEAGEKVLLFAHHHAGDGHCTSSELQALSPRLHHRARNRRSRRTQSLDAFMDGRDRPLLHLAARGQRA